MNKLNLHSGGHPLTIEDLLLMQQAYQEGFKAIGNMFLPNNYQAYIVSGCDLTFLSPGVVNISEGYVFYMGELWYVAAANALTWGSVYFAPEVSYLPPTPIRYANSSIQEVKEKRVMLIGSGPLPSGALSYGSVARFSQLLKYKRTDWNPIFIFSPNVSTTTGPYQSVYRINSIGEIKLKGRVLVNISALGIGINAIPLFTFPAMAIPEHPITLFVGSKDGNLFKLSATTGGLVTLSTHNDLPFSQNDYVTWTGGTSFVSISLNLEIILDGIVLDAV